MFEWVDRVQSYYHPKTDWDYMDKLYDFVDGGMKDESFLDEANSIVAKGCHLASCEELSSIRSNSFRFGYERKLNILNILRLVFDMPNGSTLPPYAQSSPPVSEPAIPNIYADLSVLKPLFPTKNPTSSPTSTPTQSPVEFINTDPTSSPVEFSNITILNDGSKYIVDGNVSSFAQGESLVITERTKLTLSGGSVFAPDNSEWPAIRLSVGSTINATSGVVHGSNVSDNFSGGGDGIQLNNGQSSPETAGYGEFYDGVKVIGGNGRIGGDALIVNGFGTEAFIYGGEFIGGSGKNLDLDGYSIRVINSATVHIHGGTFQGDIKVEGNAVILLYGCFMQNETEVNGLFAGDIEANLNIDGNVEFLSAAEQECETMPSVAPTGFPTLSPQPTATRSGSNSVTISVIVLSINLIAFLFPFILH